MIEIRELKKSYGRLCVLSGVTLEIRSGEVFALLGANGTGKSTILRCLLGLTEYQGSIRVAGFDPLRQGKAVRSRIGYMPQTGGLHLDLTVKGTLNFYSELRKTAPVRSRQLLAQSGLETFVNFGVDELSGGLRQRLAFVVALLSDPPVLVLDEPTASLDARHRQLMASQLRDLAARGKTILISTHSQDELLAAADRAAVLEEGRLLGGDAFPAWQAGTYAMEAAGRLAPASLHPPGINRAEAALLRSSRVFPKVKVS